MSIFRHKDKDTGQAKPKHGKEVHEGRIPVQGNEKTADDLAMKAYGDSDHDGKPDVPNVPFPG
ncbi:hypothetical protein D477_009510 [Arthrobacter crystallopoietes BAB-32]|uniref:Uncharacterized protein n=1 Tax=Arthrobacter crystallopoietes BAB-32 TaxID=1246476 RepID=N1V367_9MICC|nr:hypothetical protein [Arthrobacter crystallopoietes]EMY34449.1 hypothetical protein D477_009510 [Arthrobacter crystallopoietes BAB-32]